MMHPAPRLLAGRQRPRRMDEPVRNSRKLRQIAANEGALRVESFGLRHRIEDAEPGLGIATDRGGPLPATAVGGEVEVDQLVGEITLAEPPVDQQVLGQERGRHHAQAVVHIAGLVELAHRGIDQRVAGTRLAPRLEMARRIGPRQRVVLRLEGMPGSDVGAVPQHLMIEIAPDQFGQPGLRTAPALLPGRGGKLADGDGAEAQVHRQKRRPLDGGEIARFLIAVDAPEKIVEQAGAARHAGGQLEPGWTGGRKPHRLQVGDGTRPRRQPPGVDSDRIGLQGMRRQRLQPGVLVGREHAEGRSRRGKHFLTLENHRVLVVMDGDALGVQCSFDGSVARQRGGVVVVIEEHGIDREPGSQLHDLVACDPMPDDESAAAGLQRLLQFDDAGVDERDPTVGRVGERIEDFTVENEGANYLAGRFERVAERGVIGSRAGRGETRPGRDGIQAWGGLVAIVYEPRCKKRCLLDLRQITMGRQSWIPSTSPTIF